MKTMERAEPKVFVNINTSRISHVLDEDGETLCGKTGWRLHAARMPIFEPCKRCERQAILTAVRAEAIASQDEPLAWIDARAEGVTASEVGKLSGTNREQVLDDKLNGSTFRGNAHTERGHAREPELLADLAWAKKVIVIANRHVWAAADNRRHLATPDGFAITADGLYGVEVKSHQHGWTPPASGIPADHYDQMQFGMHVLGLGAWFYVWEVMDADGAAASDDVTVLVVYRDEARIAELIERADDFLRWVDDGAPAEQISDELATAKARLVEATAAAKTAAAAEKTAREVFEALLAQEAPHALRTGWKHAADNGTITLARPARRVAIDEAAWADAEPDLFEEYTTAKQALAETEALAKKVYPSVTYAKPALRALAPKGTNR